MQDHYFAQLYEILRNAARTANVLQMLDYFDVAYSDLSFYSNNFKKDSALPAALFLRKFQGQTTIFGVTLFSETLGIFTCPIYSEKGETNVSRGTSTLDEHAIAKMWISQVKIHAECFAAQLGPINAILLQNFSKNKAEVQAECYFRGVRIKTQITVAKIVLTLLA